MWIGTDTTVHTVVNGNTINHKQLDRDTHTIQHQSCEHGHTLLFVMGDTTNQWIGMQAIRYQICRHGHTLLFTINNNNDWGHKQPIVLNNFDWGQTQQSHWSSCEWGQI